MSTLFNRRQFLHTAAASAALAAVPFRLAVAAGAPKYTQFKKSIIFGMLPKSLSNPDKLKLAKACGFDGIQVSPMPNLDDAKHLADDARAAGIALHSVIYGGWEAPMSDPDPDHIALGKKHIENALRTAQAVGADNILLVPAVVTDKVRYIEAYERSQQHIREMIPLAEELKIIMAIEEVWNKFLLSPIEFAKYIDEFNSPCVKAFFDVGNVVQYGYPEDWIRTLGKRIHSVHIKDFQRDTNKWTPLYEGSVNWPAVRAAFNDIGYTGWITAELPDGDEAYLRELARRMTLIGDGAAKA